MELLIVMVILSILASAILPLSRMAVKRSRELELMQNLRIIRSALDEYKRYVDEGKIFQGPADSGYPKSLEILVEGVELPGPVPVKKKFLRRIPKDPMTKEGEWGLRSYFDEPDSTIWGKEDVYDIYSQSTEISLDGTPYSTW